MLRLTERSHDRGAVAVWVAILLVPFLVLAALAIDIGAMHTDRQRLQTGADAAALAIAQQCAIGNCDPGEAEVTAEDLVDANQTFGGGAQSHDLELREADGYVEVSVSDTREMWFGSFAGVGQATQTQTGAATWGYPTGGGSLPLTVSWCEILEYTGATEILDAENNVIGLDIGDGAEDVVLYNKSNKSGDFSSCDLIPEGPNGSAPSGGFGWLVADASGTCSTLTAEEQWYESDTGNDGPDYCTETQLRAMIGETILIPVFDEVDRSGSNAKYHIFGYVAFHFEGFYFGNPMKSLNPPCGSDKRCISGDIVEFVSYADGMTVSPEGPQLGAALVQLRLPEGWLTYGSSYLHCTCCPSDCRRWWCRDVPLCLRRGCQSHGEDGAAGGACSGRSDSGRYSLRGDGSFFGGDRATRSCSGRWRGH